jgi:hypothetical protein
MMRYFPCAIANFFSLDGCTDPAGRTSARGAAFAKPAPLQICASEVTALLSRFCCVCAQVVPAMDQVIAEISRLAGEHVEASLLLPAVLV